MSRLINVSWTVRAALRERSRDYEKYIVPRVRSAKRLPEEKEGRRHFEKESTTHRLPRYAFSRSRKSVDAAITHSQLRNLSFKKAAIGRRKREREKGRKIERRREAENVSLVMVGPLSTRFDASVTGASEPGTGPLVKHATVHLPWHHSLPLFPFAPFFSLLFFSHPSSSLDLVFSPSAIIPRLTFRSRRTFGDAFQRCRRLSCSSSLSCSLLYPL